MNACDPARLRAAGKLSSLRRVRFLALALCRALGRGESGALFPAPSPVRWPHFPPKCQIAFRPPRVLYLAPPIGRTPAAPNRSPFPTPTSERPLSVSARGCARPKLRASAMRRRPSPRRACYISPASGRALGIREAMALVISPPVSPRRVSPNGRVLRRLCAPAKRRLALLHRAPYLISHPTFFRT